MTRLFLYILKASFRCKMNICRQTPYMNCRFIHTFKGWKIIANPNLDSEITRRKSDTYCCEEGNDAVKHVELVSKLDRCNTVREQLHTLSSTLSLSPEDHARRQEFCNYLTGVLKPYFSRVKVHLFGSSVNNFGFKGSDVDISIQTAFGPDEVPDYTKGNVPTPEDVLKGVVDRSAVDTLHPRHQLRFVRRILREHCLDIKEPIIFIKGRCPIIRFYNETFDLFCDLSCENRSALRNTKLLRFISNFDERVGLLIRFLRYWGKQGKFVGDADMFNSYAFSVLVIYFLQNTSPPVLPPLNDLLASSEYFHFGDINDDDSLIQSIKSIHGTKNTQSPEELLKEFFFFYTYLDFSRVLLPLTSFSIPATEFRSDEDPPTDVFLMGSVCVQDPFRHSFNTTSALCYKSGRRFLNSLLEACKVYQNEQPWLPSSNHHWGLSSVLESTTNNLAENSVSVNEKDIFTIKLEKQFGNEVGEDFLMKSSSLIKQLLEHSLLFNVKTHPMLESFNQVRFEFEAINNTWVGRQRIRRECFADASIDNVLEMERQISLELVKQSTNRQPLFAFICKCILSTGNDPPSVLLKINHCHGKCSPALPIFLIEYLPTILRTLL